MQAEAITTSTKTSLTKTVVYQIFTSPEIYSKNERSRYPLETDVLLTYGEYGDMARKTTTTDTAECPCNAVRGITEAILGMVTAWHLLSRNLCLPA